MGYTAAQYTADMQAHLPTGAAWPRDPEATLTALCAVYAEEFARVDARVDQLVAEYDPRGAYELLSDWEAALGLPDTCTAAATSIAARQAACWRKLAFAAGQTPAFYIALAASIGSEIEIHEFDPDVDDFDGSLTALIAGGKYRYVWRVHVLNAGDYSVARVGDPVGVRLVDGDAGAASLECILASAKPAHTHVIFSYPET
ncbi:MAG: putative phage tail protein [Sphingomonas sp.]